MKHEKKAKGKKKSRIWAVTLVVILVAGILILLYPSVSNWSNQRVQTRAVATYDQAVSELSEKDYSAILAAAEAYNQTLAEVGSGKALAHPELIEGYEDALNITGTGMMGYITIEKINVELPIYHGTSDGVLQIAVGHLQGTSLPVGGASTHCVLSAHRGLPSAMLFTRLDEMEVGDTFTITVLDQVLTYEVDQISIVLPDESEYLYIEDGKDYCTLMTCTPYGINTHRLLVRGVRVDNADGSLIHVTAEARQINTMIVAAVAAVPLLLLLLICLFIRKRRRKKQGGEP
ncbi:MAG: class C sortase [Clostridiales bacterium]|nr:class C sortase [Clostridiales bacterium]